MSTRSSIAIVKPDGKVLSVYCHWDGYPSGVGCALTQYHNNEEVANKIIELGNISSLKELLEPTGKHSFDNPQEDVTIFYGRDRGEEGQEAKEWESLDDWLHNAWEQYGAEYCYWWEDGKWHCFDTGDGNLISLYEDESVINLCIRADKDKIDQLKIFMIENDIKFLYKD